MRWRVLVAVLALALVVSGCVGSLPTDEEPSGPTPDGELEIHHIDVGQADATVLVSPTGETMLIDSGDYRDDGAEVLAYLDEQGIDRIDHLVTTHPHADHIGGHEAVIDTYERERGGIGASYDPGVAHTTQTYDEYLDAVERHSVDLFEVRAGDSIPFSGVDVTVLNPPEEETTQDLHDNSIALLIEFGETTYLTTGDLEAEVELRLVEEYGEKLDATVYQAGHHGSSTSSSEPFLDAVDPETAIISSAGDSQFGHPHDETLEALDDRGVETYWTGAHGNVVVTSDGDTVSVSAEVDRPTDPAELLDLKPIEVTESIAGVQP